MNVFVEAHAALPQDLRALADEAIAGYRAYWAKRATGEAKGWEHHHKNVPHRAMTEALAKAGLDVKPVLPLDALTPAQRALIVVFSEDELPMDHQTAVQGYARRRRRTLGIDPPGVLEELVDGRPRYLRGDGAPEDMCAGLPDEQRFEVVLEAILGGYPSKVMRATDAILASHAQHGGLYAARTLPTLGQEPDHVLHWASGALFTALVRSGTPVPEDADRLFPIAAHGQLPIPPERVLEHAKALPAGRRERAIVASMQRSDGGSADVLASVTYVLEHLPMAEVIEVAIDYAQQKKNETKDAHVRRKLVQLEKALAGMKGGAKRAARQPKPVVLRVEGLTRPMAVSELDPIRVEQLRIAGDRWEGTERPAAQRLSRDESDEASFGGVCEWRVLADAKGTHRYDAWLHSGDAGTYFVAGTTVPIATMFLRRVATLRDGDADAGLSEALQDASSEVAGRGAPAAIPWPSDEGIRGTRKSAKPAAAKQRKGSKSPPKRPR